ncbi:hypothetical protein S101258_00800 [Lactiplantibacillus plantarum subsp. plantarum]|uniref:Uncharacterized protein n=1 Tax=Lactiplantibacillus plantarum subsp. plantarum TaxID=337330 RepID=A0A2S3U7Y9_LACPN|nr:hypothetical protein S101258_00800 [Lactiplantibacillus plantarum subsp. plantarum]
MTKDPEFNDQVLNLDGKSAFYTTFTDQQFAKLQNGMAIEAYFKYDPAAMPMVNMRSFLANRVVV